MTSGKLDEELRRMSDIVASLKPGSMVLFNESFAATNEREGSEIARDVVRGLEGASVRCVFVTHMFELAHGLLERPVTPTLFLRAGGTDLANEPFKLLPGEPLETSFGQDVYRRVFADDPKAGRPGGHADSGGCLWYGRSGKEPARR